MTLPSRNPLTFHDIESNLSLFGVTFAELTGFTLEVNNDSTNGRYIEDTDGVDPSVIHYGDLDYTFTPTIEVKDDQIFDELVNCSNSSFTANIQMKNSDGYQAGWS